MRGEVARLTKSIRVGTVGLPVEGEWATDVLAELSAAKVERVAFAGLAVDRDAFGHLETVKHLELSRVELIIDDRSAICLPALTHLHLEDTAISDKVFGDYTALLSPTILPSLTHLTSIVTSVADLSSPVHATTEAAFASLAPQLVSVTLDELWPFLSILEDEEWSLFRSLEHLRYIDSGTSTPLRLLLEQLPARTLTSLDLATAGNNRAGVRSCGDLLNALEEGWSSVENLKKLVLPSDGAFWVDEDDEDDDPDQAYEELEIVWDMLAILKDTAERRGASVERRKLVGGEWVPIVRLG